MFTIPRISLCFYYPSAEEVTVTDVYPHTRAQRVVKVTAKKKKKKSVNEATVMDGETLHLIT